MLDQNNIPQHVAIIMDGNGRWAKKRGLPRTAGHRRGIDVIKDIIKAASDSGIRFLTFFAFSTENWNRPKSEVSMLMHSLNDFLKKNIRDLNKNNIRLNVIGRIQGLPDFLQANLKRTMELTRQNSKITVNLALNYGGRAEIVDAAKDMVHSVLSGRQSIEAFDEAAFSQYLYTKDLPDPDLLIRTSGEMRISNFLLWQTSYAEFYFTKKFWPDFTAKDLSQAIKVYQNRQRRFGAIEAKKL